MDEKVVIKTKHGELTLQQLAEAQPGIARQMKEIGERFHVLYYAAKAGNWKLAQHELNVVISIFRVGGALRPKFNQDFTTFTQSHLNPISEKIRAKDWKSRDGWTSLLPSHILLLAISPALAGLSDKFS